MLTRSENVTLERPLNVAKVVKMFGERQVLPRILTSFASLMPVICTAEAYPTIRSATLPLIVSVSIGSLTSLLKLS